MRTTLVILVLLTAATAAAFTPAWDIGMDARSFEPLRGEAESCHFKVIREGTGSYAPSHRAASCGPLETRGFCRHFYWEPGMPTSGSIPVLVEAQVENDGAQGVFCTELSLGCSVGGSAPLVYGQVKRIARLVTPNLPYITIHTSVSLSLLGASEGDYCAIRVRRAIGVGSCSDNIESNILYRSIRTRQEAPPS